MSDYFIDFVEWFSKNWQFILSVVISIIFFIAGWVGKKIYDYRLKNPVRMYFLIPDKRVNIDYAQQDDQEHLVKELILPSNGEFQVYIWFKPRVNYCEEEHYFGCEGDLNMKPRAIKYFNPFIIESNIDLKYYRDWHYYYHIRTGKHRIKDEVYVAGFILKTFIEGDYETNAFVHTLSKMGKAKNLKIKVRDKGLMKVLCHSYKEEEKLKRLLKVLTSNYRNFLIRKQGRHITIKHLRKLIIYIIKSGHKKHYFEFRAKEQPKRLEQDKE